MNDWDKFSFDKNNFSEVSTNSLLFWSFLFAFIVPIIFDQLFKSFIGYKLLSTKLFSNKNKKKSSSKLFS